MSATRSKRRRLNTGNDDSAETGERSDSNGRQQDDDNSTEPQTDDLNEEQSSEKRKKSKDDAESILATCRLRHGLNEDCLCEVFKFLNVYDLIQLCELDIYFQNLITKWVIGRKLINFTKMEPCWTTNKIFQVFGKTMRRIKIGEESTLGCFERFLNFVKQYCAVGGLTHVELRFTDPIAEQTIMNASMPYFSNLRHLQLCDNYSRVWYKEFLAGIAATATNLTHLSMEGINVAGEWLTNGGMQNLRELRLHSSKRRSMTINTDELSEFLRTKTKLEVFSHIGVGDISDIVDVLIDSCPKLKAFADFHLSNPHNRDVTNINAQMMQRYAYVRRFADVATLGLTSYTQCGSDIYFPLVKLAVRNRVEAVKIYVDKNNVIVLDPNNRMHFSHNDFGHFTRLKSVELQIRSETSDVIELNEEFICDFVSNLTNVRTLIVMCEPALEKIHKIIDMAPHLTELGMSQTKIKYLPVEMYKTVQSIRKRRAKLILEGQSNPEPFHLIVNLLQWRELQVYKDVNTILKTTIDGKDCNHSFNITGV